MVAQRRALPLAVEQDPLILVHRRQRDAGVQLLDHADVAAEQRLLHGGRAEQVVGERQDLLALQGRVVRGEHLLQLGDGTGVRLLAQQRVQHRHEVALAGAEGAGQESAAADAVGHRSGDQVQGLVERVDQRGSHDVVAQRLSDPPIVHALGEAQDVVLRGGGASLVGLVPVGC